MGLRFRRVVYSVRVKEAAQRPEVARREGLPLAPGAGARAPEEQAAAALSAAPPGTLPDRLASPTPQSRAVAVQAPIAPEPAAIGVAGHSAAALAESVVKLPLAATVPAMTAGPSIGAPAPIGLSGKPSGGAGDAVGAEGAPAGPAKAGVSGPGAAQGPPEVGAARALPLGEPGVLRSTAAAGALARTGIPLAAHAVPGAGAAIGASAAGAVAVGAPSPGRGLAAGAGERAGALLTPAPPASGATSTVGGRVGNSFAVGRRRPDGEVGGGALGLGGLSQKPALPLGTLTPPAIGRQQSAGAPAGSAVAPGGRSSGGGNALDVGGRAGAAATTAARAITAAAGGLLPAVQRASARQDRGGGIAGPAAGGGAAAGGGEVLQLAPMPGAAPAPGPLGTMPPRQIARLAAEPGGGAALAPETRRQLEPVVGRPLGDVRVHRGPGAGAAARALSAQAFTIGKDVFMGAGQPGPETKAGLALLAHEATHVAQQVPIGLAARGGEAGAQEGAARAVARQVAGGQHAGKALAIGALEFGVAGRVSAELEARAPGIFALAELEARRAIDALVATDAPLRAALAASHVDEPELVVPVQLAVDGKPDAALARELGAAVARQVVARAARLARTRTPAGASATIQRSAADAPAGPYIDPAVEQMMRADVEAIVSLLRQQWLTAGEERRILEIIAHWSALDDRYRDETGYQGSDNLDKLLFFLKTRAYTRRTARSGFIEQHSLAYDDLWHELEDERLDQFRALVAKSKKQGTAGPTSVQGENFWATIGKQEAMGLWGMLKGMGTGLAGMSDAGAWAITKAMKAVGLPVADPASAADWLAKQYDISGEAMFGKEWSQGDDLFLGMKAADIGTAGGTAIWTLMMIGAGGSGPNAPASPAWAKTALVALGITGSLKGVADSANNIAGLIERMQKEGRFSMEALLTSGEFWMEATKMAASIFAAVSGASGLGGGGANQAEVAKTIADALKARVGILLDVAQMAAQVGRIIEIGLSDLPPNEKETAAGKVVVEMIATAASVAGGAAQYREEHGESKSHIVSKAAPKGRAVRPAEVPAASAPKRPAGEGEQPGMRYNEIDPQQISRETRPGGEDSPVGMRFNEIDLEARGQADALSLIREAGDWKGRLRQAGKGQEEALTQARRALVSEALQAVGKKYPDIQPVDVGTPGFGSDIDVTFAPKQVPDPTDPAAVARAVETSGKAAKEFTELLRRASGGEPDVTLDTNAYTYTGSELAIPAGKGKQAAAAAHQMDVAGLAQVRRGMEMAADGPGEAKKAWDAFRRQNLDALPAEARKAVDQQFKDAEATFERVGALEEGWKRRLAKAGKAPADEASLTARAREVGAEVRRKELIEALRQKPMNVARVRQLQAEIKLLEPGAYATGEAIADVVQYQQTLKSAQTLKKEGGGYARSGDKVPVGEDWQPVTLGGRLTDHRELVRSVDAQLGLLAATRGKGTIADQLKSIAKYCYRIDHARQAAGMGADLPELQVAREDFIQRFKDAEGKIDEKKAQAYVEEKHAWAQREAARLRAISVTRPDRGAGTAETTGEGGGASQ